MMQEKTSVISIYNKCVSIDELNKAINDKIREFKSILVYKGISQTTIAENIGVARSNVNAVIHGKSRSKYVEKALSKHGINMHELYDLLLLRRRLNEQ